ncbi:MAG: hypothetical protein IK125_10290 [Lachnospiraceae bacterium]|nr:hypothetical protein [Lachnospiraceae bacterium]
MNIFSTLMYMAPEAASEAAATDANIEATMAQSEVIEKSFELMGKGLVGIFVTIIIIMICVFILTYLSRGKKEETETK